MKPEVATAAAAATSAPATQAVAELSPLATARTELKHIPLALIRENPVALRAVNRDDEVFIRLCDSIRTSGIINAISVIEKMTDKDGHRDGKQYEIIDGLHRFTGALEVGLTEIPAQVRAEEERNVIKTQIIANLHRADTKPMDYTKGLLRILTSTPGLTEAGLATMLSASPSFINQRLQLTKLKENIQKLVNENTIPLHNAYALAKLDPADQDAWVERAISQESKEFVPAALKFGEQAKEAKRGGKPAVEEFVPSPTLRKAGEIKDELNKPTVGPALVKALGAKTAEEGFALAVAWAVQMDKPTVDANRQRWQAAKQKKEDEKKAREAEKAAQKTEGGAGADAAARRDILAKDAAAAAAPKGAPAK